NLVIEGPIILLLEEDLPVLAKPFTEKEIEKAQGLAAEWRIEEIEKTYPVSFVGTGADLNGATLNGMERAAALFKIDVPEVMNRATI
ncbi:acetamidase, partial [Planococcus sp. SIMBA_143]